MNVMMGSEEYYQDIWDSCKLSENELVVGRVNQAMNKVITGFWRYHFVQEKTGIPWFLIAAIHGLESSFRFDCCLHNGDPLFAVTTHVPIGRGPFESWEDSAMDALSEMAKERNWTLAKCLMWAEKYNGLGYLKHHPGCPSPYVWAGTSVYVRGKYARDGKFDPNLESLQCGVAAVMVKLLDGVRS